MQTIRELQAQYDKEHVLPKSPRIMYKNKETKEWTEKYKDWRKLNDEHWKEKSIFVDQKISEQIGNIKRLPKNIVQWWLEEDDCCSEYYLVQRIKSDLLTIEQQNWLTVKNYTIEDLLNGRTLCNLEKEIIEIFYKPWNLILRANGLESTFNEDGIVGGMIGAIENTIGLPIEFI